MIKAARRRRKGGEEVKRMNGWILTLEILGAWSLAASVVHMAEAIEKSDRPRSGARKRSRKA